MRAGKFEFTRAISISLPSSSSSIGGHFHSKTMSFRVKKHHERVIARDMMLKPSLLQKKTPIHRFHDGGVNH
jgi:hypothetical protein